MELVKKALGIGLTLALLAGLAALKALPVAGEEYR